VGGCIAATVISGRSEGVVVAGGSDSEVTTDDGKILLAGKDEVMAVLGVEATTVLLAVLVGFLMFSATF
jgi:hypothetical protein